MQTIKDKYSLDSLVEALDNLEGVHCAMQHEDQWNELGICHNVFRSPIAAMIFKDVVKTWPKHSGSESYPVPCPTTAEQYGVPAGAAAGSMFNYADVRTMWDREASEYAALRWELLEYSIAALREIVHG